MPTVYTQNVLIPLSSASVSSTGVITAQATFTFPTNVISASAAVGNYTISFGSSDHHVKTFGASVQVQTQVNSPTVILTGSLQLIDNSNNKISAANSSLTAAVVAWAD
jgi:hypothetical protein